MRLQTEEHMERSNPHTWRTTPEDRRHTTSQINTTLHDTETIAYAQAHVEHRTHHTPTTVAFIDLPHVDPAHRRRGAATQFIRDLAARFRLQNTQEVNLRHVAGNHEAHALWTSLGLTPATITANTPLQQLQRRLNP